MEQTINVRIKMFPGHPPRPATTKAFISDKKNARALEPGEVVALPEKDAKWLLEHMPYELEMTMEPPNRPLVFKNSAEAAITSTQNNAINRSEQIKLAHKSAVEQMRKEQAELAKLREREEAIARREAELGMREPEQPVIEEPEDDGYVPKNNAVVQEEIERVRKEAEREAEESGAVAEASAPVKRKRRGRPPKNPQPGL